MTRTRKLVHLLHALAFVGFVANAILYFLQHDRQTALAYAVGSMWIINSWLG